MDNLSFLDGEFRVVLYLIRQQVPRGPVTLPEFYAYAALVGTTLGCPEAKLPSIYTHRQWINTMNTKLLLNFHRSNSIFN